MKNPTRRIALALAVSASVVGIATSISASVEVARTPWDIAIFAAFALVVTSATYLIPAIAKRHAGAWGLWLMCLGVVLYGHAHFNISAAKRAGSVRATEVSRSDATDALRASLASIDEARSPAAVAADVARAQVQLADANAALGRCNQPRACTVATTQRDKVQARLAALHAEARQAEEALALRGQLVGEARRLEVARESASADPVDAALAGWFEIDASEVAFYVGVMKAIVLELVAAVMWTIALQGEVTGPSAENENVRGSSRARNGSNAPAATAPAWAGALLGALQSVSRWTRPASRDRPAMMPPKGLKPS